MSDPQRHPLMLPAGVASLGAGALHVGAVAAHADHGSAAAVFTALAVAQLGWGVVAIVRPDRRVASVGLLLGIGAVAGWIVSFSSGFSGIEGMEVAHSIELADGVAAALAAATALLSAASLFGAGSRLPRALIGSTATGVLVLVMAVATVPAVASLGSHSHASSAHGAAAGDGHGDHGGHGTTGHRRSSADPTSGGRDEDAPAGDLAGTPAVAPKPYDPLLPIDLGGVEGVSPQQQARAENLVAITLDRLPKYADVATAQADGYRSIGDAATGHEHYVSWEFMNDDHWLNPDYPESLVYEVNGSERKLVSAMFMLNPGDTFDDVPDVGGPLTQWHVHADLCFTEAGPNARLGGFTSVDGPCPTGTVKIVAPMMHVWITPHRCGPFAALDGVGAGQPPEGETTACDHVHGA